MENPKLMTRELSPKQEKQEQIMFSVSDSSQSAANSESDYIDNIKKVLELVLRKHIISQDDRRALSASRLEKIPVILSDITMLENIRSMFTYMDLVQFRKLEKQIIKMLLTQYEFLEALIENRTEIDEHFRKLAIEIHKFLNEYRVQAVLPFQFQAKIQRRLDSLARILTPHSRFSVCVALTIVGQELYISANHEGYETDICANYIWNKLVLFRDFFKQLPTSYYLPETFAIHQKALNQKIDTFLGSLIDEGGSSLRQEILMQAVQKSIFACGTLLSDESEYDDERQSFNQHERFAILNNPVVTLLVPSKRRDSEADLSRIVHFSEFKTGMQETDFEGLAVTKKEHLLGEFKCNISIRFIHCEQLLIYFLDKIKAGMSPRSSQQIGFLRLGISKLCCQTCIIAIDEWNQKKAGDFKVGVRGWHKLTYDNVVNLVSPQAFSLPSIKKSPSKSAALTFDELTESQVEMIHFVGLKKQLLDEVQEPVTSESPSNKRGVSAEFGQTTPKRFQEARAEFLDNSKPFVSPNSPYQNSPPKENVSNLAEERISRTFSPLLFPSSLMEVHAHDKPTNFFDTGWQQEISKGF